MDSRPGFRPRAWMEELPPLDAFGTLVFQVAGQQLSVSSTRAIISHLQQRFGGHLPTPAELLAADPQVLRDSGFSARKGETLRALAERFVDGRLSEEALSRMTDEEVEATLTDVPGIGPWTARGFLLVALDRPDVFLSGDLALRRDATSVRLRPPSDRRRSGSGVGSLEAVSEPCSELPLRVRIRRATVIGPSDGNLVGMKDGRVLLCGHIGALALLELGYTGPLARGPGWQPAKGARLHRELPRR